MNRGGNTTMCELANESYFPLPYGHDKDQFWRSYEMTMSTIVIPGIVGNTFNIIVLSRGNWKKSSSWLIFALAVADTMYLLGVNNVALHLYAQGNVYGFKFPETPAQWAYYCYMAQVGFEISGKIASMLLPCLITIDRLIAVTLPLRYSIISYPRRVIFGICCIYFFAAAVYVIYSLKNTFIFTISPMDNATLVGLIVKSQLNCYHYDLYSTAANVISLVYGPVPTVITVVGCAVIGSVIYVQGKKRQSLIANTAKIATKEISQDMFQNNFFCSCLPCFKKEVLSSLPGGGDEPSMSASESDWQNTVTNLPSELKDIPENLISITILDHQQDSSSNIYSSDSLDNISCIENFNSNSCRQIVAIKDSKSTHKLKMKSWKTTRTLLSVCIVYCIANTISFLVLFYFHTQQVTNSLAILVETSRKLVLVFNSACNFLFYVGLNRNFRIIYKKLVCVFCQE